MGLCLYYIFLKGVNVVSQTSKYQITVRLVKIWDRNLDINKNQDRFLGAVFLLKY